jgi:hypothetical protein
VDFTESNLEVAKFIFYNLIVSLFFFVLNENMIECKYYYVRFIYVSVFHISERLVEALVNCLI